MIFEKSLCSFDPNNLIVFTFIKDSKTFLLITSFITKLFSLNIFGYRSKSTYLTNKQICIRVLDVYDILIEII